MNLEWLKQDSNQFGSLERKDAREDDFMLDAVDFDPEDMEDNERKNKYKRNSPNVKLNRMGKQSKKQPQSQQKGRAPRDDLEKRDVWQCVIVVKVAPNTHIYNCIYFLFMCIISPLFPFFAFL